MEKSDINTKYLNVIRVVIETTVTNNFDSNTMLRNPQKINGSTRHCNVLLIDNEDLKIFWFQPGEYKYQQEIQKMIMKYLGSTFPNYLIVPVDMKTIEKQTSISLENTPGCDLSGFCVAYCIKYVYDVLNDYEVDLSDIRRFASKIEKSYPALDPKNLDIEYGFFGNNNTGTNVAIGGLGGATMGTLLTGGSAGGLLAGGLIGGTAGYLLSNKDNNN